MLSAGERQRIALCRLLWHRPEFAALDESTSALDEVSERKCIRYLMEEGISLIAVSHRVDLATMFDKTLTYEEGEWVLRETR